MYSVSFIIMYKNYKKVCFLYSTQLNTYGSSLQKIKYVDINITLGALVFVDFGSQLSQLTKGIPHPHCYTK